MWALPPSDNSSLNEGSLNAVKITFLSWASGSAKVSYERAIPAWNQSAELCAGYIGAGGISTTIIRTVPRYVMAISSICRLVRTIR